MSLYLPETDILYLEFGTCINKYVPVKYLDILEIDRHGDYEITNAWRIKVLEECIKLCQE